MVTWVRAPPSGPPLGGKSGEEDLLMGIRQSAESVHHPVGTCRMGDDPSTSVVNRYGQVHEIDNLYVADGSTFVTNAGFNPSLTILAMGYWIGDHLVRKYV